MEGYFLTMDCLVYTVVATSIAEVQALYRYDPFLAPIRRQNSNVKLVSRICGSAWICSEYRFLKLVFEFAI